MIPVAAVRNLFKLLDRHPELVEELDVPAGNDNGASRGARERA